MNTARGSNEHSHLTDATQEDIPLFTKRFMIDLYLTGTFEKEKNFI